MATEFPNFTQMKPRVPRPVWDALRAVSIVAALALCVSLFFVPRVGLFFFWGLLIPLVPLVFLLAPGFWRNVCPLASVHQLPRRFGLGRGLTLPGWLQRYGYLIAVGLFLGLVPARKVLFNTNGAALALLLLAVLAVGLAAGAVFKGKSGWCSTFCPLLPVQRIYGQTPFAVVRNSHCEPCVGCTVNCYDFNPRVAQLADLHGEDERRADYRRLFAGAFVALVLAFYTLPTGHGWGIAAMYGKFGLALLAGVGAFFLLDTLLPVPPATMTVLFGAAALNAYYWFNVPNLAVRVAGSAPWWWVWPGRALVLGLTLLWIWRSFRKEERFVETVSSEPAVGLGAGAAGALRRASEREAVEVTLMPDRRTVAVAPGATLLEIAERNGLSVEAGCRMGVCGSDPVCVLAGAENLSEPTDEERATLERLGLADTTRMACSARAFGAVTISATPQRRDLQELAAVADDVDTSVRRVVIVGNGIAGVTAADYVRRRNPECSIELVGRERHHLYNRMAITRLIYGRSAMQGLYLMPDAWYDEHRVSCWLNTELTRIDPAAREVTLATGDTLPYDRLILTAGSSNFVPPIEGFGARGSVVLRTADDAMAIRGFVLETRAERVVVAGGGLLGIEVAYALQKLGLRVTVLSRGRLLDRQLDERGAQYLGRFLAGLGLEILSPTEALELELGQDGRVQGVVLNDGRSLPCDLFVVSTGIAPNVELARAAGLEVGRGILVDDGMRTSDPSILAAGDVAEHQGLVLGLWPTAVEQAKVAATNATGGGERYESFVPATALKVTGVDLTSVGRLDAASDEETVIVLEEPGESRYRKLVVAADGTIAGAILLGYSRESPGIIEAVKSGRDVRPLLDDLRAGDWSAFTEPVGAGAGAAAASSRV